MNYELVYILSPKLSDEDAEKLAQDFNRQIRENATEIILEDFLYFSRYFLFYFIFLHIKFICNLIFFVYSTFTPFKDFIRKNLIKIFILKLWKMELFL